jgi:hypothetical protein
MWTKGHRVTRSPSEVCVLESSDPMPTTKEANLTNPGWRMRRTLALALAPAALIAAPLAHADFDNHGRFKVQVPPLLCAVESDGAAVCQGEFPQAPVADCPGCPQVMHWDQAVANANGQFNYRDANIGVGDNPTLNVLTPGQSITVQNWSFTAKQAGLAVVGPSGHGMYIGADGSVNPI